MQIENDDRHVRTIVYTGTVTWGSITFQGCVNIKFPLVRSVLPLTPSESFFQLGGYNFY